MLRFRGRVKTKVKPFKPTLISKMVHTQMNPLPLLVGTETTGQNLSKTIQSNTPLQKYYTPIGHHSEQRPKVQNET